MKIISKFWINCDQSEIKSPRETIKKAWISIMRRTLIQLPERSVLPLSNRGVTALPTGLTHGVPGIDGLMTKHPTTRKWDWWIGRFPLKRP